MQKIKDVSLNVFFLLGERLGFFLLLIIAIFLFATETPSKAFSETKVIPQHYQGILVQEVSLPNYTPTPLPTIIPTSIPTQIPTPIPTMVSTPIPTADPTSDAIWENLADCESHKNWSIDSGNGYYGAFQFSQSAWESVGGSGNPAHASKDEQIAKAKLLQASRGWSVWGACAKRLGLY